MANSIVVITSVCKRRWALVDGVAKASPVDETILTKIIDESVAKSDYNGKSNTQKALSINSSTEYAAGYCNAYTFPDGVTKGHWHSLGECYQMYLNKTEFINCWLIFFPSSSIGSTWLFSSTYKGSGSTTYTFWDLSTSNGTISDRNYGWGYTIIPVAEYE